MSEQLFCRHCDRLIDLYNDSIASGDWRSALVALNTYDDHRDQAHGPGGYPA